MAITKQTIDDVVARWPDFEPLLEGELGSHSYRNWVDVVRTRAEQFDRLASQCRADRRLSVEGRRHKLQEFAERNAGELRQGLETIATTAAEFAQGRETVKRRTYAAPPADAYETAILGEIRAHLRSLSAADRLSLVSSTALRGDHTALRAAMLAPDYLSGLDPKDVTTVRDAVFEREKPDVVAKHKALDRAADVARMSVERMLEFMDETIAAQREPMPPINPPPLGSIGNPIRGNRA